MSHGVSIAPLRPADYLPDIRRAALPDILERNLYFRGSETTSHSTLTVNNEQAVLAHETMRVRSVQVAGVTGGTVTVQVLIDGIPLFEDAHRPVSDTGVAEPSTVFNFPPGSIITTRIAATSGTPAGAANVVIDTEPFVLVPRTEEVELKGKNRLFPSRRRAARNFNESGSLVRDTAVRRSVGTLGSGSGSVSPAVGSGGGSGVIGGEDAPIPGIPPGAPPPGKGGLGK